ncbi:uncharacterized protein Z520_10796 [Fonsecaea multimorphosa CBS 102226]|uniref:Mitochondrial adapter protein MCP1 transmembrane domain-containing protein n=1 Tax=Fonsecaea multimorphosa CBS 102226 TaxID=1442371 RepID=A0A0D2KAS6_9EURO|nr:uncharacterized protein Z520_10796 [Fonsecaea multimorphosa CBS 102226]KIX93618.1 hypothetical protein Z520_10796 [Fonsecaea multimorphosa CBS 102226]OAL18926.1 hypothetical protein AYO22_10255 [Fonsecaea multimorphosa]
MADLPPLSTQDTRGSVSAVPMHEVDPSPVDDDDYPTNPSDLEGSKLPPSHYNTTNWLGLTPARTQHILLAVQKYSVVPFSAYLAMHYTNTALIPLLTGSAREADKYLLLTRPYYQSFPLEPLLIFVPVITHVASGIALRLYRRRLTARRHGAETLSQRRKMKSKIPWPKLSLTSAAGYALYPMFVAHMLSMRIIPKQVDGSSASVGLRYFAHGIAQDPYIGMTSYALFVSVASYHVVSGAAKFLKLSAEYVVGGGDEGRKRRTWRGRIVNGVAAAIAGAWVAGGLGVVGTAGRGTGWEASHWDKIYRAMPVIGRLF